MPAGVGWRSIMHFSAHLLLHIIKNCVLMIVVCNYLCDRSIVKVSVL